MRLKSDERERFVIEQAPMVRGIARNIRARLPKHVELDDLISAGNLGLLDACERFDAGRKIKFKTYATTRIRGAMLDSLRDLDWGSREVRHRGRLMGEATARLTAQYGRTPTDREVAGAMGVSAATYQHLLEDLKGLEITSLNDVYSEDGEELLEFVADPGAEDPLQACVENETIATIALAIEHLPERERLVITLYYYEGLKLDEIGAVLGIG